MLLRCLLIFGVGIPNAICVEISHRTQLLSEDTIRLHSFPADWRMQNMFDSMTNLQWELLVSNEKCVFQLDREIIKKSCCKLND